MPRGPIGASSSELGGNDKSASHATGLAGTETFKTKCGQDFPRVSVVESYPGRVMTKAMGILAAPKPKPLTAKRPGGPVLAIIASAGQGVAELHHFPRRRPCNPFR